MKQQENQVPANTDTYGKTVWIGARAHDEHAERYPLYVRWVPKRATVDRILSLQALVLSQGLCRITAPGSPDRWGSRGEDEGDYDTEMRLWSYEMVVDNDSFWFTADPSHSGTVETHMVTIEDLLKALACDQEHVFFHDDGGDSLRDEIEGCGDVDFPEVAA